MEASSHPDLDPLQNWVVEKFHFAALFSGVAPSGTPLALLSNGQGGESILTDPELVELVAPLAMKPEALRAHLVAAYRTIEG